MKLLILGGTRFLGRHLADAALARRHRVTLFNRGIADSTPRDGVEQLRGDRDGGLSALDGGRWDAVLDTSGYVPRLVRDAARRLARAAGHYTFVSSLSVYETYDPPGLDEGGPLRVLADPTTEAVTGETYGGLKVLCEREVERAFPGRALRVRAGLLVGPHDYMDRFPYWSRRIARGGEVLAPGRPGAPLQLVDARDLADWMVRMAEASAGGVFNATGPEAPLTIGTLLETCRAVTASDATLTWVDDDFLLARGVAPLDGLQLWVPPSFTGFNAVSVAKAVAAGLGYRPLADTVRDTFEWDAPRPPAQRRKPTMIPLPEPLGPQRERELLAEWHAARHEPA